MQVEKRISSVSTLVAGAAGALVGTSEDFYQFKNEFNEHKRKHEVIVYTIVAVVGISDFSIAPKREKKRRKKCM